MGYSLSVTWFVIAEPVCDSFEKRLTASRRIQVSIALILSIFYHAHGQPKIIFFGDKLSFPLHSSHLLHPSRLDADH